MKTKLFKRSAWTLLTVFFVLVLSIVVVADQLSAPYSFWIDDFFNVNRYILVDDGEASENQDTQYFKSDYAVKDENGDLVLTTNENGVKKQTFDNAAMRKNSLDVAERVVEEGTVLLWNKNNALPLEKEAKISNFGITTVDWTYTGYGSGAVVNSVEPDLQTSLESRGLQVNPDMIAMIQKGVRYGYSVPLAAINEMPWDEYSASSLATVANFGDAAIFTVSRWCGEAMDLNTVTRLTKDGSVLSFSEAECSVLAGLQKLKQAGTLEKIILVINTASPLSLKYASDYDIDACLWTGWNGSASTDGLADLLVGNANPSGHLVDTWAYDIKSSPANENYGARTFTQSNGVPPSSAVSVERNDTYVVYQEGIYVGYLYYETRYEDLVLGGRKADSSAGVTADGSAKWDYNKEVAYTFGHGESYTTFEYGGYSVKKNGKDYEVSMTVKNTGKTAGKEVMQVYLQKPYTEYDVQNKVEKAAVQIVGFAKTKLLAPDESQQLTVTVPEYEFKSYDSYGAGTYILEKGNYYLAAGRDAHDALNNILAAKGYTKADGMDAEGNQSLAYRVEYTADDFETYSVSPFTGNEVRNRFNDVDLNLYEGAQGQEITYLSRSDWEKTYPAGVTLTCTSAKMIADMQYGKEVPNDPDDRMPVYDTVTSKYGRLSLIQLMDIPYDDPLWDDLLNQMTFEEQAEFVGSCASGGATSIAAPGVKQGDGPCGLNKGTLDDVSTRMSFPCNVIIASTFNRELAKELGEAFGNEMLHYGYTGLYGLACNIHRSAIGGRNYEYYSEDGFLSGAMLSAESEGLRSKGIILYTKHLVLNDQEDQRWGITTWANEQTIREIYLKAFETGVTKESVNGIMTSYNRIGCTWTGVHSGLLTGVLRQEWNFRGIAITDAVGQLPYACGTNSLIAAAVIAGQDAWMGGASSSSLNEFKDNPTFCLALRETARRVCYTQLHSAAMNGVSSTTHTEYVKPAWEKAITCVEIVSGIFTAVCLCMAAASWVVRYQQKNKKTTNQ